MPAVDEEVDPRCADPGEVGQPCPAGDPKKGRGKGKRNEVLAPLARVPCCPFQARFPPLVGDFRPSISHPEGNPLAGDGYAVEHLPQMGHFRPGGLQEFQPGGDIPEEVRHFDGRSARGAGFPYRLDLPSLHDDFRTEVLAGRPGEDPEPGHRGNRGESLPAEPVAGELLEILGRGDLARGVAADGSFDLIRRHAYAVVGDPE